MKVKGIKVVGTILTTVCLLFGTVAVSASASEVTGAAMDDVAAISGESVLQIEAAFGPQIIEKIKATAETIKAEKEDAKAQAEQAAKQEAAKTTNTAVTTKTTTAKATKETTKETPATGSSLIEKAEAAVAASGGGAGRIVALANLERAKAGLGFVGMDGTLSQIAQVRAQEIVEAWSHTRPDGSNVTAIAKEYGYSYARIGENLAKGQKSADQVVSQWMGSASHKAVILGGYSRVGVGIYQAGGKTYWVALFAN